MVRVCHVVSGDLWAGAEVMVYNLLNRLREMDEVELSVVILNEGRLHQELHRIGLNIALIEENRLSFVKMISTFREFLKRYKPQIIHSHRYKENLLAFFSGGSKEDIRLLATQHGMPEVNTGKTFSAKQFIPSLNRYILSKYYDMLVVVSAEMATQFRGRYGFFDHRLCVIHNGIELLPFKPSYSLGGRITIGSAGRLFPVKDFALMVKIANELVGQGADVQFFLAGEGPERGNLEARISEYGLEKIFHLRGHIDNMHDFYSTIDCYINTSIHEGIPMSILEAMSHGLPVIAPNVGGLSEIISDGVDGHLVSERTTEAFADKCIRMQDDYERGKMGAAARGKIKRLFSAAHMAEQYYCLYRSLL